MMRSSWLVACALTAAAAASTLTQNPPPNYDEAQVPAYTLPDPLVMSGGERVRDAATWTKRRRAEIIDLYRTEVYGRSPAKPAALRFTADSIDRLALGGRAVRKQVTMTVTSASDAPAMHLLIYVPTGTRAPVPVFIALSFSGNQAVAADPGISLGEQWSRDQATGEMVKRRAAESTRGAGASQWQLERILQHGYALATMYYGDVEPDFPAGLSHGIRPLFFKPGQTEPSRDEWAAIAAWAWGLSRMMDYVEGDRDLDARRAAVMGHSRLGKAALWAGAQDTRFSIVISNESGEGGAAISRRLYGERTRDLNTRFPHWFDANYKKYNDRESEMPFDSHLLLSLVAPRALYVASAEEDRWSDPRGEFLGAMHTRPVYELLGKKGIDSDVMPGLHQPVGAQVRYHIRAGRHDVTAYDWEQYLAFADTVWLRRQ